MTPLSLLLTVYGTVLAAELLGDKTLYTLGSLAARYPVRHLAPGALAAFMAKMAVAVLAGRVLQHLSPSLLRAMSAITFFVMAITLWRKAPPAPPEAASERHWSGPALAAFAAVFFSEWGDPGQLAAATFAARHDATWSIWAVATLAMATKGALGLLLGIGLRRWVPHRALRPVSVGLCVVLGVMVALGVEL